LKKAVQIILILFTAGCGWFDRPVPTKIIATPDVVLYSLDVQARALKEKKALGPPCPRDVVIADCSALHRFVLDYKTMRDRARCLSDERACR
jgi:hypothetical protein